MNENSNKAIEAAIIDFKGYKVEYIELKRASEKSKQEINVNILIGDKENESLKKSLKFELNLVAKDMNIKVVVLGAFEFKDTSLNDEQMRDILSVNGAAILYPYVRTLISFLTSYDSETSILLPTLNFLILSEESRKEQP